MILLGSYEFWLPTDASSHGGEIDRLIVLVHWFMLIVFVGWGLFFLLCLLKFRSRSGHQASTKLTKFKAAKISEVAVVIIEVVLLLGFSIPIWAKVRGAEYVPSQENAMVIRVIAQQFAWNVHYPGEDGEFGRTEAGLITTDNPIGLDGEDDLAQDDIITLNQMHIPVNQDVLVHLSSRDVIHSFAVPTMRIKQDAIPGMTIPVWFRAVLTTDQVREQNIKTYPTGLSTKSVLKNLVAMASYKDTNGRMIVDKGDLLTEAKIAALAEAGIDQTKAAPAVPTEISCAQLCGLMHYRMRGYLHIDTAQQFAEWMAEQEPMFAEGDYEDY